MEQIIESMLFAYGKPIKLNIIANILEKEESEVKEVLDKMKQNYFDRGFELIQLEDSYTLVTKSNYSEYVYKLFETKLKPNITNVGFEVLSIIAYNPNITRAEVEKIRGVNSDSTINRLIEYEVIEESGRKDVPGKPIMYKVSDDFYKLFGYESLNDLPAINFQGGNDNE